MLCDQKPPRLTPLDEEVFNLLVPQDHVLRQALRCIDWQRFRPLLAPCYSADQGRPSHEPLLLLKLEFLRYKYGLSDSAVVERTQSDVAFRYFLQLDARALPPDSSTLSIFRGRLGAERFRGLFEELIAQAREQGIVKDRLRIKDATHVVANVAIPTALVLLAQIRDKLLTTAQPWAATLVAGERINVQLMRERYSGRPVAERLEAHVHHLRDILTWADKLATPEDPRQQKAWNTLVATRQLAHKILADHQQPENGDCTRSVVDADARRAKHGAWYDGYLLDILMDADSELITAVNVLSANGDEAVDAIHLVQSEEEAHGNDIEALSMDGAGYNGPLLQDLEDPRGLGVDTYVPPRKESSHKYFTTCDFTHHPEDNRLTCPAGKRSRYRQRDKNAQGWIYRFARATCADCPLQSQCMESLPPHFGKTVHKSQYHDKLQGVRDKAKTEKYSAVRKEHYKVERKLADVVNHYGGRRARYRGREKVLCQEIMACFTTNISRLLRLHRAPNAAPNPA
jgi:IS5 family transposase